MKKKFDDWCYGTLTEFLVFAIVVLVLFMVGAQAGLHKGRQLERERLQQVSAFHE